MVRWTAVWLLVIMMAAAAADGLWMSYLLYGRHQRGSLLPRTTITNSFRRRISSRLHEANLLASFLPQPKPPPVSFEALVKVIMVMVLPHKHRDQTFRFAKKTVSMVEGDFRTFEQVKRQKKSEQKKRLAEMEVSEYSRTRLDALFFSLHEFRTAKNRGRVITKRERLTLRKPSAERSDSDLLLLTKVINRLPSFQKYPVRVHRMLARNISFDEIDEGRVVIRAGHVGTCFYSVITGRLAVTIPVTDKITGETSFSTISELGEGSSFGELALLHDIRRTATVYCKDDCELLRVDRVDFRSVLQAFHGYTWQQRVTCMDTLPHFSSWTPAERHRCTLDTKIREHKAHEVLFGNTDRPAEDMCFLVHGECHLVRCLSVGRKLYASGKIGLVLPRAGDTVQQMCQRRNARTKVKDAPLVPETHYWIIGTLKPGDFYGAGEDMTSTYVISKTRVELLVVPRLLFTRTLRWRQLDKMRLEAESRIASTHDLLTLYAHKRDWEIHKTKMTEAQVRGRRLKHVTTASLSDVPRSIKTDDPVSIQRQNLSTLLTRRAQCHVNRLSYL